MRVVNRQQAERKLELADFQIRRRIEIVLNGQPINKIRFADLDIIAVRLVRRIFREKLNIQIAACCPLCC